ncbi:hypothetical protein J26TS2_29170 [Shouchella clausii]|uniref:hypothetical protein n=1 Tax=Shouchella tritolerans TaxID=2979466 RepID=UPI001B1268F1|nr:hypothetical protein [Shouchella tritolerans]GIN13050.1 hypothetical protein J26TS2_29170 [Shouchella clausii]
MKKFLVSFIMITLLASGMAGVVNAESTKEAELNLNKLKDDYEAWFKEEVSNSVNEELIESYSQYNELSEEEQLKFIDYLYNPEIQETVMEAFSNEMEVTNVERVSEKLDGYEDIVITTEIVTPTVGEDQEFGIMANRTAKYWRYVTFLGIKVFQTTSTVDYSHNGSRVTSVGAGDHYVSRNLNPTLNISWSGKRQSYTSTRAQSRVHMQWNFIHKGLGITYGAGELGVWGNHKNQAGGWFYAD